MSFRKILGIVLIVVGVYLCYSGEQRRTSLAGGINSMSVKVANRFDGEGRVASYVWYYVGGGVLAVAGAVMLLRRS